MPRYIRIADVPAILAELKEGGNVTPPPYQLDAWQKKWCKFTDGPEGDVAVLSYRWRVRGANENIKDYKTWMSDCGKEGYAVYDLRDGPEPVDWSLADGHAIQIEVAAWLLWLYTNRVTEYAWVDQMCVPQDADIEEKMTHIKDSPAIYTAGKVYVIIAPVVDYASGRIMLAQDARALVKQYNDQMNNYRGAGFLSRSAVKALMVNNSYMRRVWTIQEAVAAQDLTVWPLKGRGEVNSYQSIYVVDWPEFNAWNGHPELGPLYLKYSDEPLNDYYEGDYTGVIKNLREHVSDAIAYLAMISKDLMWITMDRNGLVNDVKKAGTPSRRAWVLLNNHQIQSARSFLPEDRVLALIPLVDYDAWKSATSGVPGRHLVQASVNWAYELMEHEMASWKWSIRIYNAPRCAARGLELLQPRRNLGDSTSMHGATPGWQVQIPPAGGTFTLSPPPSHADASVTACLKSAGALSAPPRELQVEAALIMPHPGQAQYWGGGPWTHIRDVLQTDEVFRLSVQWGLEPWRNPELGIDAHKSAVVVASGGGLAHPVMIIMAVPEGADPPTSGQVMEVVEVSSHLLPALLDGLRSKALGHISSPITVVSAGVVPPPPPPPEPECAPAPTEPEWQVVTVPKPADEATEAEAAPAAGEEATAPATDAQGEGEGQAGEEASASADAVSELPAPSAPERSPSQRPPSAKPSSRPTSARPASARPASARPASAAPGDAPAQLAPDAAAAKPAKADAAQPERPASAKPTPTEPEQPAAPTPAPEVTEERPASVKAAQPEAAPAELPPLPPGAEPRVVSDPAPREPPAAHIYKGGEASVPYSGVEVAAGAKYAGQAPVVQGEDGPCKGCVIC